MSNLDPENKRRDLMVLSALIDYPGVGLILFETGCAEDIDVVCVSLTIWQTPLLTSHGLCRSGVPQSPISSHEPSTVRVKNSPSQSRPYRMLSSRLILKDSIHYAL
jgi:hypothetical protein